MNKTMTIKIYNKDQSQPMEFEMVDNTYVEEGFFCIVRRGLNEVQKFPIENIFRVIEPYYPEEQVQ